MSSVTTRTVTLPTTHRVYTYSKDNTTNLYRYSGELKLYNNYVTPNLYRLPQVQIRAVNCLNWHLQVEKRETKTE